MKIVCSSICYEKKRWPQVLDAVAQDGWKHVELVSVPGWITVDVTAVKAKDLQKEFSSRGLSLYAVHAGLICGKNGLAAMYQMPYYRAAVDLLAEMGADQLVFTGTGRADDDLDDLVRSLEKVARMLEGTPVKLGLENHYQNRVETIEDYDYILQRIDHPQIGITADFGHFNSSKVDTAALLRKHAKKIVHTHIKDHQGTQSVRLGEGEVDLLAHVKLLKELGYTRGLSVELEVAPDVDLDKAAADARKYMDKLVGDAGV